MKKCVRQFFKLESEMDGAMVPREVGLQTFAYNLATCAHFVLAARGCIFTGHLNTRNNKWVSLSITIAPLIRCSCHNWVEHVEHEEWLV